MQARIGVLVWEKIAEKALLLTKPVSARETGLEARFAAAPERSQLTREGSAQQKELGKFGIQRWVEQSCSSRQESLEQTIVGAVRPVRAG